MTDAERAALEQEKAKIQAEIESLSRQTLTRPPTLLPQGQGRNEPPSTTPQEVGKTLLDYGIPMAAGAAASVAFPGAGISAALAQLAAGAGGEYLRQKSQGEPTDTTAMAIQGGLGMLPEAVRGMGKAGMTQIGLRTVQQQAAEDAMEGIRQQFGRLVPRRSAALYDAIQRSGQSVQVTPHSLSRLFLDDPELEMRLSGDMARWKKFIPQEETTTATGQRVVTRQNDERVTQTLTDIDKKATTAPTGAKQAEIGRAHV